MIQRVYIQRMEGPDQQSQDDSRLLEELKTFFGDSPEAAAIQGLRILYRYDAEGLDQGQFTRLAEVLLAQSRWDLLSYGADLPLGPHEAAFAREHLTGYFDPASDHGEQQAELLLGLRPKIKTAQVFVFQGQGEVPSPQLLALFKGFILNPQESREIPVGSAEAKLPSTLEESIPPAPDVPVLVGFISLDASGLTAFARQEGLAMSQADLLVCQAYFQSQGRDPSVTELRILDTYWSDHCRHSTFNTELEEIKIQGSASPAEDASGNLAEPLAGTLAGALALYEEARQEVYGPEASSRKRSLMDMATIGMKVLKKRGLLPDLDESPEVNACTIKVDARFTDGSTEPYLLLFKNETHNHPTEIEPFGGAATCLGGGIRDPLSGRAYVHQAMRISGGADPRALASATLPGKLPQLSIARKAAAGYSSYGNQVGVAGGQVAEFYHPGFLAKRMELGALIGGVPQDWVRREEPRSGDVVILVGGKTGRDGIGGATGSSVVKNGGEAQGGINPAGNPLEERKLIRLFRKKEVCALIKRRNDFGAGGVSVAVGEIAAGLDINLDAVPPKYPGMDGTELAISESQERMAVVTSAEDSEAFIKAAAEENLEAVIIAQVTTGLGPEDRVRMSWRGKTIADLSRSFLDSNGAPRSARALLASTPAPAEPAEPAAPLPAGVLMDMLERELMGLRSGSRRGLIEQFDSTIGDPVLFPWGGPEQGTPECGMAALLPSLRPGCRTASLMSFGYDPVLSSQDPYAAAKGAIREALAKIACMGGDPLRARLSLQEFFESCIDPESWGLPAAALLGALEAQLRLGVPAIGGKDSMSGNYRDPAHGIDIKVPPTLVAFAAGVCPAEDIRSGVLQGKPGGGNPIVLLSQSPHPHHEHEDEWDRFKNNLETLKALSAAGALRAAYPVASGGIALTLALMAFGGDCGLEAYAEAFGSMGAQDYQGSIILELDEAKLPPQTEPRWTLVGRTLEESVCRIICPLTGTEDDENPETLRAEVPLVFLKRAYEYPLAEIYPQTSTGATWAEAAKAEPAPRSTPPPGPRRPSSGAPLVYIPVLPDSTAEWDLERAFSKAGARTRLAIFRNRTKDDTEASIIECVKAIKEAQVIALSSDFCASLLMAPRVQDAVRAFLDAQQGLILGICGGFRSLVKTGLLPYGAYTPPGESSFSIMPNLLGRHVSRMVRTKVLPSNSPWLSLDLPRTIHTLPVSHSHGRLVTENRAEGEALFAAGQVPFVYAGFYGDPALNEPENPSGSAFGVEGLSSPDGRILGKMALSQRRGDFFAVNIPGNKEQRIFEAAMEFFA